MKATLRKGNPFPLGVSRAEHGIQFAVYAPASDKVSLKLYQRGRRNAEYIIVLGEEYKTAHIFSVIIEDMGIEGMEYTYEIKGRERADAYGRKLTGMEKWAFRSKKEEELGIRSVVRLKARLGVSLKDCDKNRQEKPEPEDLEWEAVWKADKSPKLPYSDVILYQLHVRGFTKHRSSGIEEKGTFKGIERKIPYLKELGVTSILLLPAYEFDEWIEEDVYDITRKHLEKYADAAAKTADKEKNSERKLNYWGYSERAWYFLPKTGYAYNKDNPEKELKELIAALHKEGMELLMDLHFAKGTNPALIMDCLRFWVLEYHVDGFRINDDVVPAYVAAKDPVVGSVKLLADSWDGNRTKREEGEQKNLAEYNDGYRNNIRRFLKGDEGQVSDFLYHLKRNPDDVAVINYVANNNGFTLQDMVSYDVKHNEDNGENGRDGSELNFSWNCGVEGKTRRKNVLELRKKQIKNALLMLFLSQGTPMLLAGDEFGDTREGNNNPYCQDNEISWVNWNLEKKNQEQLDFVKKLIALRKEHRILHMPKELRGTDYAAVGYPDISFHGTKAWYLDESNYNRMAAVMLAGRYVRLMGEKEDNSFYIAYNMHWEQHEFDLPKLTGEEKWEVLIDTGREEPEKPQARTYLLQPRSIVVLTAKEQEAFEEKKTAVIGKSRKKK